MRSRRHHQLSPVDGVRSTELLLGGERYVVLSVPTAGHAIPESLTTAEREVCELVLSGLTNAQIAEARRCSARTVANQCAAIFRKVGVTSRAELRARLSSVYVDEPAGR